jgi:hypothetical protein
MSASRDNRLQRIGTCEGHWPNHSDSKYVMGEHGQKEELLHKHRCSLVLTRHTPSFDNFSAASDRKWPDNVCGHRYE